MGFEAFFGINTERQPLPLLPECGSCGLYKACHSPKMPVFGDGKKGILLVSDYPGREEDFANRPFVGKTGRIIQETLRRSNINLGGDCWSTNALICKPETMGAKGLEKRVGHCQPNLIKVIEELKPRLIIPMGTLAIQSVLTLIWKGKLGAANRWWGWQIPSQKYNAWICPTFNPAALLHKIGKGNEVMELFFRRHIRAALRCHNRPWGTVPNWQKNVEVVLDPVVAAAMVRKVVALGGPCAWDYETNMLKPDSGKARILACSISYKGKKTFAFPWQGEVKTAMKEFVHGPNPKIAANMKFEERWTIAEFGRGAKNWLHDVNLMAHILDNRRGISSLKFQSFVMLGQPYYAGGVEGYIKSSGSNEANRLDKANRQTMLLYNGLDSLLTYKLYLRQAQ